MTKHKSFKRIVRARMDKTGESYTAARAAILAAGTEPDRRNGMEAPLLTVSDESLRSRTGRGWEEWLDLLDEWDVRDLTHGEIAARVFEELGDESLGWWAQAITVSYERVIGRRAVGQRSDGTFSATASKTVVVPVETLYAAFVDEAQRERWLPGATLTLRTAAEPRSARFDDGETRLHVFFEAKGDAKSTVSLEHARLADAAAVERKKAYWRRRLAALAELFAGAGPEPNRTGSAVSGKTPSPR